MPTTCDYEPKISPLVSAFLLVQNEKILQVVKTPDAIDFELIDERIDWGVYAGVLNEFSQREIVGCVAKVWCSSRCNYYTLQTIYKGHESHSSFLAKTFPSEIIKNELQRLYLKRVLDDPCQLGIVKLFTT